MKFSPTKLLLDKKFAPRSFPRQGIFKSLMLFRDTLHSFKGFFYTIKVSSPYYFTAFLCSHFFNFIDFLTQIQKSKDFCKKLHLQKFQSSATIFRYGTLGQNLVKMISKFVFVMHHFYFMLYLEGKNKENSTLHTCLSKFS